MGRNEILTEEQKEEAARLYAAGLTYRQIADRLGVRIGNVFYYLHNVSAGLCRRDESREKKAGIARDYMNGIHDTKYLAGKYGCTRDYIYKVLRELQVDLQTDITPREAEIEAALRDNKTSQSEIARRFGVTRQYISAVKKRVKKKRRRGINACRV